MNSKQWLKLIAVTAIALLIPRSTRQLPHSAAPDDQAKEQSPSNQSIKSVDANATL